MSSYGNECLSLHSMDYCLAGPCCRLGLSDVGRISSRILAGLSQTAKRLNRGFRGLQSRCRPIVHLSHGHRRSQQRLAPCAQESSISPPPEDSPPQEQVGIGPLQFPSIYPPLTVRDHLPIICHQFLRLYLRMWDRRANPDPSETPGTTPAPTIFVCCDLSSMLSAHRSSLVWSD
ncbi:hypothetical protein GY45DRAFT_297154 [Cubamyces sp. BRFM 1775]|nr:hypothetical protein GY45DRAFT_297154 [Cubamyces sp. BRFM 1775]